LAETTTFTLTDEAAFRLRALEWADQFSVVCLLDSNGYPYNRYSALDWVLAIDALDFVCAEENSFDALKSFIGTAQDKVFGFLTYDLKNQIEDLTSANIDNLDFPALYFFKPRYIIEIRNGKVTFNRNYPESFELYERIMESGGEGRGTRDAKSDSLTVYRGLLTLTSRTSKDTYLTNVNRIKTQIKAGDFYEINYCCEFYAEHTSIQPLAVFNKLNTTARAPFSTFFKLNDKYLLCASPERFLKKIGDKIISQPIKGTIRKGTTEDENQLVQNQLQNSEKERAENVMIVDLVRNDLSKSAKPGTVQVEELFGIYEFPTVNQMISTVSAELMDNIHPVDVIKGAFPMGSMTGAPKVEVMKNIEAYEDQKRGLYSGSVGYFTPGGDFDLNVVIRSIFYNAAEEYVSIHVGSAITYDADPDAEYAELLLKAKGMLDALDASIKAEVI
jgi:para-aminobenzoate synthetase component 1